MESNIIYNCVFNISELTFLNADSYFDTILNTLKGHRYRVIHNTSNYLPIHASAVERSKDQGKVVVLFNGDLCICIRQLSIDFYDTELTIEDVDNITGNTMSSAKIYEEITFPGRSHE